MKTIEGERHIKSDAVVVGGGVLGLLIAKQLGDLGQTTTLIDKSPTIPNGSSNKNHNWIHTGIVHSLSTGDPSSASQLVKKLQYGHSFYTTYAKECIEDPFTPTYAITRNSELADMARQRWTASKVPYTELTSDQFRAIEPGLNQGDGTFFFENTDTRINNRLLFKKLATEVRRDGGTIFAGVEDYDYTDSHKLTFSHRDEQIDVEAPLFFYATGAGLSDSHQKLTGTSLPMQYWKSHLLFMPRLTEVSIVSLDRNAPIIINHRDIAVVNRSYDEVPLDAPDTIVDQGEVQRALEVVSEYYPVSRRDKNDIHAIACIKPNVSATIPSRHSVGEKVYEPVPGHIFALPGKMTEAPYVADKLVRGVAQSLNLEDITPRPIDVFMAQQQSI